jgi:hypothetical protein
MLQAGHGRRLFSHAWPMTTAEGQALDILKQLDLLNETINVRARPAVVMVVLPGDLRN